MEKKKSIILTTVAVATLVALVVGATYAYFQASVGSTASAEVKVTTYTSDLLTFTTGNEIAIYADQSNFADGLGNRVGESFARAHLLANNKTNTATANYYVYLNITSNSFEYTQEDETAELILQVTDPNGVEVTSLSELEYVTVTDGKGNTVKGFDITTVNELITIANNYEITANNESTQTWNIKVVFVNLDADQNDNTGKSLAASIKVQKEEEKTLANWVIEQYESQTSGSETIYLHNSSLANGAGDNSYRYAGASEDVNNFVCFGSDAETCPDDNLYRIIGVFEDQVKLIKWDYGTTALLGTDGDSNGACSTNSNCNYGFTNNTYKGSNTSENIGAYWWNNDGTKYGTNTWSASKLNTVNLNKNFLTNIEEAWANKIATTTWKVGGVAHPNVVSLPISDVYYDESNPPVNITYNAKIALMYTSDYGFAAAPSAWIEDLSEYHDIGITMTNWMYMGLYEWTVGRVSDASYPCSAFSVFTNGAVDQAPVGTSNNAWGVRPVFYLESGVNYDSGDGTKSSPVRLG